MNQSQNDKVTARHLRRNAYLYIRQSTLRQVFEKTESTRRQYALSQRALALGWSEEQLIIIDSDLGQSGASAVDREGFQRLVTEVGMGRDGIVLGLEVSRLARNSSDWHRLLEICALTGTLILDEDGIYDPCHFNDRLLLGMKGAMSEAELHVLQARLQGGLLNKARRGQLALILPIGFSYDAAQRVTLDPDTQVVGSSENCLHSSIFSHLVNPSPTSRQSQFICPATLYFPITPPRSKRSRLPVHDFIAHSPVDPLRKINNLAAGQFTTLFHGYSEYRWERCKTIEAAQEFHRELIRDYNRLPHWAHRRRNDGKHSPLAVLGDARGKQVESADLERAFAQRYCQRLTDTRGFVRIGRWRIYIEDGLPRTPVQLSFWNGKPRAEYQSQILTEYQCKWGASTRYTREIETRIRSPNAQ